MLSWQDKMPKTYLLSLIKRLYFSILGEGTFSGKGMIYIILLHKQLSSLYIQ